MLQAYGEPLSPPQDGEAAEAPAAETPEFTENISIICTSKQESALASTPEEADQPVEQERRASRRPSTVPTSPGKVCIVLVELDQPLVSTLDAGACQDPEAHRDRAKGILWVVKGAYTDSTNPQLGMILGLARTVRSESG